MNRVLAIICLITVISNSSFGESNFYVGAGGGISDVDRSEFDSDSGFKVFLGYNFCDYFAGEAEYSELGEFDVKDLPGVSVTIDDGFKLASLGRYPLKEWFIIMAKLGVYWWDAEGGFFGVFLGDDNSFGASFTYGTGVQIGTKLGLRLE